MAAGLPKLLTMVHVVSMPPNVRERMGKQTKEGMGIGGACVDVAVVALHHFSSAPVLQVKISLQFGFWGFSDVNKELQSAKEVSVLRDSDMCPDIYPRAESICLEVIKNINYGDTCHRDLY